MHKNDRTIELEQKITEARNDYYNNDTCLISDAIYDAWVDELKQLDPTNYILGCVGADAAVSEWIVIKHEIPMGSLNKLNTKDEMLEWSTNKANNSDFVVMDKLDGLSLNIKYENGEAVSASLRGNGNEGEDIYANVKKMNGFKQTLPGFSGHIRGEILMSRSAHVKHFPDYANPRNGVSGICRRFDGTGCQFLNIKFYQAICDKDFATEMEHLDFIKNMGLDTPLYFHCKTANDINNLWDKYQKEIRAGLDYEIDGLVIRINDVEQQSMLGETNMRPNGAIAFKFDPVSAETTIKSVIFQTGLNGRLTPVAIFDSVNLLGVNVSRASLHNMSYIKERGIDVGAKVLVFRANDVIPKIEVVVEKTGTIVEPPKTCPECGSDIEMSGEYLICPNTLTCPAQKAGRIKNWVNSLNLLEWGTVLAESLVESGKVNVVSDLYKLTVDDLATLPRMGEKSAKKAYDILWNNTNVKLENFIDGLSIPLIGKSMITILINAGYDTLDKVMNMSMNEFEKVQGFGAVKAKNLYNGLVYNKDMINELLLLGIKIKPIVKGKFTGKLFCFTGTMAHERKDLEELVKENGGGVKSSVVKNLSYLVCEDTTTTKYKAAKKNNVPILSEQEFLDMLEE